MSDYLEREYERWMAGRPVVTKYSNGLWYVSQRGKRYSLGYRDWDAAMRQANRWAVRP